MAALGRPGYINLGHGEDLAGDHSVAGMEARAHTLLDFAWKHGIRYFDTARSYGRGEQFLGSWLRQRKVPTTEATIGSKWGYTYTAGWSVTAEHHEIKEHSLPVLRRQIEESRTHLGPYLHIYHIHSATLESGVLDNRPVLEELSRLRAEAGWLIGLSLSGTGQPATLEKALGIEIDGRPLFASVQATWNILEPSCGALLAEAAAQGWGVLVKEVVANGRLTPKNPDQPTVLTDLAADLGVSIDAIATAAALSQPWAAVVLSGAATISQLASNLTGLGLRNHPRITALHLELAEPPAQYWQKRSELQWN